ncbi:PREDICTED: F-box protein CPR30-like [Fragaria vesca subsp. vesca]
MSGLGYDAIGNDYKVVRLTTLNNVTDDGPSIAQVYSLARGSWGVVHTLPLCVTSGYWVQVFVNGALHWPAYNKQYFVLTFDVASESFGEINLPMRFQSNFPEDLMLSASGDRKSIALFHSMRWNNKGDYFLDIWVMKEYSEEQSWTKLLVLSLQGPERSPAEALCFKRSGEVILVRLDSLELVSLDLVSKQFKALGISGGQFCSVHCYEESLVLLDTKDAVSY